MTTDRSWERLTSLATRPPGPLFHLLLVPPALAGLYAVSVPGLDFLFAVFAGYLLFQSAIVWSLRLAGVLVARARGRATANMRWFAVAPLGAVLVGALVWTEAPLRARWALSRGAFERAAAEVVEAAPGAVPSPYDRRLGLYQLTSVWRVEAGVLFYEKTGALSDDAGFAYLPDGPSPAVENGLFESPRFRRLGEGWYAWTASW